MKGVTRVLFGTVALAVCIAVQPAMVFAQSLNNLSDNTDCSSASTVGVVVSRSLIAGGREIEGFRYKDKFGESYVNVSLPDAMSRAKKADAYRRIISLVKPGSRLKLGVHGCGASGRIEVLDSIAPAKG